MESFALKFEFPRDTVSVVVLEAASLPVFAAAMMAVLPVLSS
jgi:hypothetical protein